MKSLTLIAFCFLTLFSSAQNDIISINLDKILDTKAVMKTTDFFELVEFIPLETTPECLTTNSYTVLTSDAIYMFSQGQNCILKFDREGNFITKIGRRGRGPGEFCSPKECMIQYYDGFIYLTDGTCKKILKYSSDGELQDEISLKGNPGFMFSDVLNEDCFIIVKLAPLFGGQKAPYTEVMTFNSKGRKVKEFPLFTESTNRGISIEPFILWHFDDKLYYKSSYSNTAYVLVDFKTVKPVYKMTIKKEETRTNNPLDVTMPFGTISSIYETDNYQIINGAFRLVYNKSNGDYYKIDAFDKEKKITKLDFLWPSAIFRNESKVSGEYISVINPYELVGIDFNALNIESEYLRSELIKLQKKVNENDNPIIVVMKEK